MSNIRVEAGYLLLLGFLAWLTLNSALFLKMEVYVPAKHQLFLNCTVLEPILFIVMTMEHQIQNTQNWGEGSPANCLTATVKQANIAAYPFMYANSKYCILLELCDSYLERVLQEMYEDSAVNFRMLQFHIEYY